MQISDIYKVSDNLDLASASDINNLESILDTSFPEGYTEYVTELGHGILSIWVRVYMPGRIRQEYKVFQDRLDQYYFWDTGKDVLTKEQAVSSIIVADTIGGDELYLNAKLKQLFVLPRHSDTIYAVGTDSLNALEWLCISGELTAPLVDLIL